LKLSREFKTGIIVIGGILLFILGFSYLKSTPLFENSKTFYAVYKNVGGLQPGTPVTINGFNVGTVNDIKFKDASGYLVVTFSVSSSFEFSKNSKAELYDTGIIGGKGIQIIPVFDGGPMGQSGDTLSTDTRPGLTELLQQKLTPLQLKVEGAVSNADSLLMNVNDVLDDKTRKSLRESIQGLTAVIENFRKSAETLNGLMESNKSHIDSSLTNIDAITANFARLSDTLVAANLGTTIKNLEATIGNLNALLAKVEKGEGSLGKLMKNEELYNNMTDASRELDLLLQDFRLNPKRYVNVSVFGKKQIEYTVPADDPAQIKQQ
jgi:phospholipid/cholesterol/gamma-HCH transport system substrate-binding protein